MIKNAVFYWCGQIMYGEKDLEISKGGAYTACIVVSQVDVAPVEQWRCVPGMSFLGGEVMETVIHSVLIVVRSFFCVLDDDIALLIPRNIQIMGIHVVGIFFHFEPF